MAVRLVTIILTTCMRAFCFNRGRNQAKQHSSVVDWSWLNKNMKDRLLIFYHNEFYTVNFTTPAPSELNRSCQTEV